jgi:hypothetical protein
MRVYPRHIRLISRCHAASLLKVDFRSGGNVQCGYKFRTASKENLKGQCHQKFVLDGHTGTYIRPKLEDGKWFHNFLFLRYSSMIF